MDYLAEHSLVGTEEPFRICLTCYEVLRTAQDSRAAGILERAQSLLRIQAARIADDTLRRSLLENVIVHRTLLAASAKEQAAAA